MPEQREQDDDGQRDADQPKQSSTSKTHSTLLLNSAMIGLVQPNASRGAGFPSIESYLRTLIARRHGPAQTKTAAEAAV
jgi:hypothetical protein